MTVNDRDKLVKLADRLMRRIDQDEDIDMQKIHCFCEIHNALTLDSAKKWLDAWSNLPN